MAKKFVYELFRFAFFPNFNGCVKYLAKDLAAKEEWDYSDTVAPNYTILKNYLEHTFRKLLHEKKLLLLPIITMLALIPV